jgi:hypothetical protein
VFVDRRSETRIPARQSRRLAAACAPRFMRSGIVILVNSVGIVRRDASNSGVPNLTGLLANA